MADPPRLEALLKQRRTPIVVLDDVIEEGLARECIALLDEAMFPALRRMYTPIPREALVDMKENYTETLPKTVRVRTSTLNTARSKAIDAARECGLSRMMSSKSFLRVAQNATVPPLREDWWARQVICYESGGYSGPHNDHHPEEAATRNGFVDLHVMFSNRDVASQSLIYEDRGYLSAIHEVSSPAAIAIYRLPFWHYTTPLVARPKREATARRWLLLGSFNYEPALKKLEY